MHILRSALPLTEHSLIQLLNMADAFNREAFTLLGVGTAIVGLRSYARISMVGFRRLMLDDYLMVLALVSSPLHHLRTKIAGV